MYYTYVDIHIHRFLTLIYVRQNLYELNITQFPSIPRCHNLDDNLDAIINDRKIT